MIINQNTAKPSESLENTRFLDSLEKSKTSVGYLYKMKENEIRSNKYAMIQGHWFLLFLEMIEPIVESLKFLELRPRMIRK